MPNLACCWGRQVRLLSLWSRWEHHGWNNKDKITLTSRPINTIYQLVVTVKFCFLLLWKESSTNRRHLVKPITKEKFLLRQQTLIRAREIGNWSNQALPLSFFCPIFCAFYLLNKPVATVSVWSVFSARTFRMVICTFLIVYFQYLGLSLGIILLI